jgi:hypothetical protein
VGDQVFGERHRDCSLLPGIAAYDYVFFFLWRRSPFIFTAFSDYLHRAPIDYFE